MAAARGIAAIVPDDELREDYIVPSRLQPRRRARPWPTAVAREARSSGEPRRAGESATRGRHDGVPRDHRTRRRECSAAWRSPITGATGRSGARLVARAAPRAATRCRVLIARPRPRARGARRRRRRLAARGRARARGGARRARRRRAPRRRARRPALDRRRQARHPRVARARHAQPRRRAARRRARGRGVLVSASAVGYYGPRGDEPVTEDDAAGRRLPRRGRASAGSARRARRASSACASCALRTGVVLDQDGGALAKMLPFFQLGIGGPVAGGRQYMPWIHVDDVVGVYLAALDDADWSGPVNADRARAARPTRSSPRRSAARCAGRPSRRCPASRCGCSTARWPRSS